MDTWSLDTGERLQHTYGLQVTHLITNCIRPVFGSLFPASDTYPDQTRTNMRQCETMEIYGNIWIDIYIYYIYYIYMHAEIYDSYQILAA